MKVVTILLIYIACINIAAFAAMGIDKWRAARHAWRIPEHTLFVLTIFGGSLGGTLGMFLFHHKTRHWYFRYGFPLILAIHVVLIAYFVGTASISIM